MKAKDVMTPNPSYCTPETRLPDVAGLMCSLSVGQIPVVEDEASMKLVGVVTDRDITCRTVAKGINPLDAKAAECMSQPVVWVPEEASLDECLQLMRENQVRRLPVVDQSGALCGIVAQADLARYVSPKDAGKALKDISEPSIQPGPAPEGYAGEA